MANGLYALNATTGARLWHYIDSAKTEVISSPAIVGPPGAEVVAFATFSGTFQVVSLARGTNLYQHQTGGFVTASPAYVNGHFLITSADGFVYDFAARGGAGTAPKTSITSPAPGSTIPYASQPTVKSSAIFVAPGATFTATGSAFNAGEKVDFLGRGRCPGKGQR